MIWNKGWLTLNKVMFTFEDSTEYHMGEPRKARVPV